MQALDSSERNMEKLSHSKTGDKFQLKKPLAIILPLIVLQYLWAPRIGEIPFEQLSGFAKKKKIEIVILVLNWPKFGLAWMKIRATSPLPSRPLKANFLTSQMMDLYSSFGIPCDAKYASMGPVNTSNL